MQEINRISVYNSAKELWEKLIALYEGTLAAKLAKWDLLRSLLGNLWLGKEESMANLHSRLKEILTGLSNLGEMMTNCDILRSAINAFPRMTQ